MQGNSNLLRLAASIFRLHRPDFKVTRYHILKDNMSAWLLSVVLVTLKTAGFGSMARQVETARSKYTCLIQCFIKRFDAKIENR